MVYPVTVSASVVLGEWSGGRISWDQNSTFSWGQNYDLEIEIMIMRSKLQFFMRSKLWSWDRRLG